MILTSSNYHSREANQYYMSNSQFKDFEECEALAMAKIRGDIITPPNDSCLLGSYVHAWVEGTLDDFKASTPELFKSNGQLYAKYEAAAAMIETIHSDQFIQFILQGEKEVILTDIMFGAPWKVKLDVYNPDRKRIVDLKTVREIRGRHWDAKLGGYVNFIEAFQYARQMAIYAEIERLFTNSDNRLEPLIVAISKEDVPDKEVIGFDQQRLQSELDYIESKMERIISVKNGLLSPDRCEQCIYCRRTKQLRGITHYSDLMV